jgi:hypothetical protein
MKQIKHVQSPYEKDFYKWAKIQANLLKKGDFEKLDLNNVIEEIEALGRSERRELKSRMIVLLMHLLKREYQPNKRTQSWDKTIRNERTEISIVLDDSPSLRREMKKVMEEAYSYAVSKAAEETKLPEKTFPKECPWDLKAVMQD